MFGWIASHWREWLSRPEWWQAWAAFASVLFAALLYRVTAKYVKLTKQMLDAQIDPVIDLVLDLPPGANVSITNNGSASVLDLRMESKPYRRPAGSALASPIVKLHSSPLSRTLQHLEPGDTTVFQMKDTVDVLSETRAKEVYAAEHSKGYIEGPGLPSTYEVLLEVSYQRKVDLRRFTQTRRLRADWQDDGTPYLTDAAMFQKLATRELVNPTAPPDSLNYRQFHAIPRKFKLIHYGPARTRCTIT